MSSSPVSIVARVCAHTDHTASRKWIGIAQNDRRSTLTHTNSTITTINNHSQDTPRFERAQVVLFGLTQGPKRTDSVYSSRRLITTFLRIIFCENQKHLAMTARDSLRSCSTIWRFCCCLNAIYWGSALYGVDSFSIEVPRHSFPKQQQSNSDTLLLRTRKSNKTNTTKDKESTRVIPHGARTIEESHCPLACQNGSICVRREKQTKDNSMSKSSNNKTQQHYDDEAIAWKCTCPPGFEGTLCELSQNSRPRQRVVTLFVPCGNLICLYDFKNI